MRTTAELTQARALIERLLEKRGPWNAPHTADVLRGQMEVLDWVIHRKFDAFAVRLIAAKAERSNPIFRTIP